MDVIGSRQQISGAEMSEAEDIWHVVDGLASEISGEKAIWLPGYLATWLPGYLAIWLSGIDSRSRVRSSALRTM